MAFYLILGGSRVLATHERRRKARCGRCLEQTTQGVASFERTTTLYYVEVASDDLGRIAQCEACQTAFPVKLAEGESPKDRWADSFLDAHVFEIERADKSEIVSVLMIAVGVAALGAVFWGLTQLDVPTGGDGSFSLFLFLGGLAFFALLVTTVVRLGARVRERIGDPIFARAVRARLAHLDARWEIRPADLVTRANIRGYPRLARHFSTSRYIVPTAPDTPPYRS